MRKHARLLVVLIVLLALPYLALGVAGWLFLYQQGWALVWFGATLVTTAAVVGVLWWFLRGLRRGRVAAPRVVPSTLWPPKGLAAWEEVEEIAARVQTTGVDFQSPEKVWELLQEILEKVARHYHPKSSQAVLEMPVPHLLQVLELVCRDLREALSQYVPGSHILTVNELSKLHKLANLGQQAYVLYRIIAFAANPTAGIMREAQMALTGNMTTASVENLKNWAVDYTIKRVGYYAIELYSGYLVLDDRPFDPEALTQQTSSQLDEARQQEAMAQNEPLRVLLVGQVKAGKSSLVNALFGGQVQAATDVLPATSRVTPYFVRAPAGSSEEARGGELPDMILLDTGGYEDTSRPKDFFSESQQHMRECDLVVLVLSATNAAREADYRLLAALQEYFAENIDRASPPILAVITHIDQLRPPREWNPPYDLTDSSNPKAASIRQAVEVIAGDLQIPPEQVVPVCLAAGRLYNVEEGVIPAILNCLPEASRLKLMRCFRIYRDQQYWGRLWEQAGNSGRLLIHVGKQFVGETARRVGDIFQAPTGR